MHTILRYSLKLAFCFLLIQQSSAAFSQTTDASTTWTQIGKVGSKKVELSYKLQPAGDTLFHLKFPDASQNTKRAYKTLRFSGSTQRFYEVMKSVFLPENRNDDAFSSTIKLGEEEVVVKNFKRPYGSLVRLHAKGGTVTLSEKQVDKLFGRR